MMGSQATFCSTPWCKGPNSLLNSTGLLSGLVSIRVCCHDEDVFTEILRNLTLVSNVLLEIVRGDQRQKRRWGGRLNVACGSVEANK